MCAVSAAAAHAVVVCVVVRCFYNWDTLLPFAAVFNFY